MSAQKQKKTVDIVLGSNPLKNMLKKRLFEELGLSYSKIVTNAKEDGIKGINKSNLSKYFGSDKSMSGSISQKSLLYLSVRYGIIVRLSASAINYNEQDRQKIARKMFAG